MENAGALWLCPTLYCNNEEHDVAVCRLRNCRAAHRDRISKFTTFVILERTEGTASEKRLFV
jgi:hypothetical protein